MRKIILINLFILIFLTISSCSSDNTKRFRILAASNMHADLEEKTFIKNQVMSYFDSGKLSFETFNASSLKSLLKQDLEESLYNKLAIKECISYYPAKSFNGKMIPSGSYETILITIGKGEGHNFWTLLYPEYYGFEFSDNNEIEYRSYFYDLFSKFKK